jgi:cytoskeletal protein CcmA (bactofilin family)
MESDPRGSALPAAEHRPDEVNGSGAGVSGLASLLGPTLVLRGELSFREPLVIQGQLHGSATGTASIVIEKSACLSGKISAEKIQFERGALLDDVVLTGRIQRTSGK